MFYVRKVDEDRIKAGNLGCGKQAAFACLSLFNALPLYTASSYGIR
jgi:hypothetical protein